MPNHLHGILWIQSPMPEGETIIRTTKFVREVLTELPEESLGIRDPIVLLEIVSKHKSTPPLPAPAELNRASLSVVIGAFKSATTKKIHQMHSFRTLKSANNGQSLWQAGFHEHILANERSLARVRRYISANPIRHNVVLSSSQ